MNPVRDMKQIYHDYKHIIIAVEMSMFGPWGEMHSSKHSIRYPNGGGAIKTDALKKVHRAYMSALPTTHSVLVCRPYYIPQIVGNDTSLTFDASYKSTPKACTGYHNDAYINSEDDGGTFNHGWNRSRKLDYVKQFTSYTFFGGEYNNAKNALYESKLQHMTYLNRGYKKEIYSAWGKKCFLFKRSDMQGRLKPHY